MGGGYEQALWEVSFPIETVKTLGLLNARRLFRNHLYAHEKVIFRDDRKRRDVSVSPR